MRISSTLLLLAAAALGLIQAGPAGAMTYSFTGGSFDDSFSVTTANAITIQTLLAPTSCTESGTALTSCQILFRPAGSTATIFNGNQVGQSIADGFLIAFDSSTTYYLELATGAFGIDGDHSIGSNVLNVSGVTPSATQTTYDFTDGFDDSFSWTAAAPVTGPTIIRPESCSDAGVTAYNCQILFDPAGSAPIQFGPYATLPTESQDWLLMGLGATVPWDETSSTWYSDAYAAGSFATYGVHNTGESILTVSGQSAAPEAATWLTMVAGFGLVGAGMRRRRAFAMAAC